MQSSYVYRKMFIEQATGASGAIRTLYDWPVVFQNKSSLPLKIIFTITKYYTYLYSILIRNYLQRILTMPSSKAWLDRSGILQVKGLNAKVLKWDENC